jgi:hypothetical protein
MKKAMWRNYVEVFSMVICLGIFGYYCSYPAALVVIASFALYFGVHYFSFSLDYEQRLKDLENKIQDLYIANIRR